jgi:hypothetical protein
MKRSVLLFAALACCLMSGAAKGDFLFSVSDTDANAGSDLVLQEGTSGSMHVWMSTEVDQRLIAASFNIAADDDSVVDGLTHLVNNPTEGGLPRWTSINDGTVNANGNLVDNTRAFYIPGITQANGIETTGPDDFVLFSSFDIFATGAVGTTAILTFTETSAGVAELGGSGNIWDSIPKGTGSVSITAIPEPGSCAVLVLAGLVAFRRKRN